MATFEQLYDDYRHLLDSVANEFGRTNHQHGAEGADFAQELAMWLMGNAERVSAQEQELEGRQFAKWLSRCLRNECLDYALDIKAQAAGYERRDLHFYTKGELKVLLDAVFDEEAWLHPPQVEGGRSPKAPAEGNNWVATLSDVARAFDKLDEDDREMLRDFHERGWRNGELAKMHGVTEAVMSYRHGAVLGRLLKVLGGPAPKPMRKSETDPTWRGRHAISNAAARARTAGDYED
jgi:RNA polymerase sigma factor (sigma-70 family)